MKRRALVISLIFLSSILFIGTFIYSYVEGWRFLDSLYFVVVTVTTIGYGDIVPLTDGGKVLTMILSFFGVAMALYFFTAIGASLFKKHVKEQVSEIKEDVKKEQEVKQEIKKVIKESIEKPAKKKK